MSDVARAKVEEIVAEMFGIAVDHIRLAPRFCGEGYDGDCLRESCNAVIAVDILSRFLAEQTAALRAEVERLHLVVRTAEEIGQDDEEELTALRAEVERLRAEAAELRTFLGDCVRALDWAR